MAPWPPAIFFVFLTLHERLQNFVNFHIGKKMQGLLMYSVVGRVSADCSEDSNPPPFFEEYSRIEGGRVIFNPPTLLFSLNKIEGGGVG